MFSGIIEEIGVVKSVKRAGIAVRTCLNDVKEGDSISVNGICLTVTKIEAKNNSGEKTVFFDFSPETASKTTLSGMTSNNRVNLERAMKFGDRIGGHFLSGHIEDIGRVSGIEKKDNSLVMTISLAKSLAKYIAVKGSIGVEGASLTVTGITKDGFSVSLIPFTINKTTLGSKKIGDTVNIETDLFAKYIENMINARKSGSTSELLKENGFI
jgi:riboflavin synthase